MPTFQATIETSYHQFDLGDAGGTDPKDMNRNYTITPMTDSIIRVLYSLLNNSWSAGIHQPNGPGGAYTPIYAPFSWDLSQPFKRPYILNNYPKLCVDINAYQGAETKKSQKLFMDYEIELSLQVPISLSVELPKESKPGDTVSSNINFKLNETAAKLIISPKIRLSLNLSFFFYELLWNTTFDQQIIVHLGTGEIEFMGFKAKIFSPDQPLYQSEPRAFGNYVQFQYTLNPKVVGEILSATFDVGLVSLINSFVPAPYSTIIKAIFDEISLRINPVLTGYLKMDILAGATPIVNQAQFNSSEKTIPVSFTMPEGSSGATFALALSNLKYGVNFATHWSLEFDWAKIPSIFVDDFSVNLGTWPNMDIDLAEGTAIAKEPAKWTYDASSSTWKLENFKRTAADIEPDTPSDEPGMIGIDAISLISMVALVSVLTLMKKVKQKIR